MSEADAGHVAPRAGAWIETPSSPSVSYAEQVAPRAGAWIETKQLAEKKPQRILSLPVRERGLKHNGPSGEGRRRKGRSPCGSVD